VNYVDAQGRRWLFSSIRQLDGRRFVTAYCDDIDRDVPLASRVGALRDAIAFAEQVLAAPEASQ
jgi:hypothetical protein